MKLRIPKDGDQLLEMEYLEMRAHLLEVAAAFDRIERAGGTSDSRLDLLRRLGRIAVEEKSDRAQRVLNELSE